MDRVNKEWKQATFWFWDKTFPWQEFKLLLELQGVGRKKKETNCSPNSPKCWRKLPQVLAESTSFYFNLFLAPKSCSWDTGSPLTPTDSWLLGDDSLQETEFPLQLRSQSIYSSHIRWFFFCWIFMIHIFSNLVILF